MSAVLEATAAYVPLTFSAHDGLRLFARVYGERGALPPVLCLAGITRNSADFDALARFLASHPVIPRQVYALDYRGRGRSEYDANWRNYSPFIEMLDVQTLAAVADLRRVHVIGTSRGGIIAMLLAAMRPGLFASVVLNDIGPKVETAGLARLMGYVGKVPLPVTWTDAARIAKTLQGRFFPKLADADWLALAHDWWMEEDGRPAPGVDPAIARTLSEIDISEPVPEMWTHFDALRHAPMLALRGEYSDILSADTLAQMQTRHPRMQAVTVPQQGHAPLLRDRFLLGLIGDFLREAEGSGVRSGRDRALPSLAD